MPNRVIIASQKGGQSKTTSTVILAEILASIGYTVLVVDFDSQGNTTAMLTKESIYKYSGSTIMEAIKEGSAKDYIVKIRENLDLIPADDMVATFPSYIYTKYRQNPLHALKNTLADVEDMYDFVFIDLPPSLGDSVANAIVYADFVIIPADYGSFAMDAMDRYIEFVDASREEGNTNAIILGILLVMKSAKSNHERDVKNLTIKSYGDLVFNAEIRRKTKIKEFAAMGVDIDDPALADYMEFTREFIERIKECNK